MQCKAALGSDIYLLKRDGCSVPSPQQVTLGRSQIATDFHSLTNVSMQCLNNHCIDVRQRNSGFWDKLCILQRPWTFPRSFGTPTVHFVSAKSTVPCILQLLAAHSLLVQALALLISFAREPALQSTYGSCQHLTFSTSISYSTQPTALLGLKSNDNFTWLRILKFGLHSCRGNYKWNILFILFPSYTYIFILLGMFLLACFPNV